MPTHSRFISGAIAGALGLACLTGCRSAPEQTLPTSFPVGEETVLDWTSFPLGPGDVLRVYVYGHPELSTPEFGARIDNEGSLSLPLVGLVTVWGVHVPEARERIATAYREYVKEPRVEVSVLEYGARRFYVYGEVDRPGAYPFDRPLNAYQALSHGGSFKPTADRAGVVLVRRIEDEVHLLPVDAAAIDATGMVALLPDDFLFVPRSDAGDFAEEILPYLQGLGSSLGSLATLLLIDDRLNQ